MRRAEAEVRVLAVLHAQQFPAVQLPAAALFPQLLRLHGWHQQLLAAVAIQLFADDLLDLADAAQQQRQVVVDAGGDLLQHAGAHHQLLADDIGVARRFAERKDEGS